MAVCNRGPGALEFHPSRLVPKEGPGALDVSTWGGGRRGQGEGGKHSYENKANWWLPTPNFGVFGLDLQTFTQFAIGFAANHARPRVLCEPIRKQKGCFLGCHIPTNTRSLRKRVLRSFRSFRLARVEQDVPGPSPGLGLESSDPDPGKPRHSFADVSGNQTAQGWSPCMGFKPFGTLTLGNCYLPTTLNYS